MISDRYPRLSKKIENIKNEMERRNWKKNERQKVKEMFWVVAFKTQQSRKLAISISIFSFVFLFLFSSYFFSFLLGRSV